MLKFSFCLQLLFLVFLFHLFILVLVFVQSTIDVDDLHIIASKQYELGADVMIIPFKKIVEQPIEQKKVSLESLPEKTTLVKELKPVVQKKEITKKVESKVDKVDIKKPFDKITSSQDVAAQEKAGEKEMPKKEEIKKDIETKSSKQKEQLSISKQFQQVVSKPQPQQIGTRQLQTMHVQRAIAQQVQTHWQPPAGFADDAQVTLAIELNYKGEVADIDVIESSQILVFDIHARSAVYAMDFPRACWGKKITITFKQ